MQLIDALDAENFMLSEEEFINKNSESMKNEKTEILRICDIEIPLAREFILEEDNIVWLLEGFEGLKKLSYDFSDENGVKDAEKLKTIANKFIKDFKAFCDPLEEEGKSIAATRSKVKLKLEAVVAEILKPVNDVKEKLRDIRGRMIIKPIDIKQADDRMAELENLKKFNWLSFKNEAFEVIEQFQGLTLLHKNNMEAEKKAKEEEGEKVRNEREEKIRQEAAANAKAVAQKEIDEANKRAEQAKEEAVKLQESFGLKNLVEVLVVNPAKEHQAKIHNELLKDFQRAYKEHTYMELMEDEAKEIIKAIAKGQIRHLKIIY